MRLEIVFSITLLVASIFAYGQSELNIRPIIGVQIPLSHLVEKGQEPSFAISNRDLSSDFGLELAYEWSGKNVIAFGYHTTSLGTGYKFGTPASGLVTVVNSTNSLRVFPIGYFRKVGTIRLFARGKSTSKQINIPNYDSYRLNLKVKVGGGLSFLHLVPGTNENQRQLVGLGEAYSQKQFFYLDNFACFGRISFQFFNRERNALEIAVVYSRGLLEQVQEIVDYRIESPDYNHRAIVGSNGSYISVQLSYPFKIWRRSK
jgi:hypothetical protein